MCVPFVYAFVLLAARRVEGERVEGELSCPDPQFAPQCPQRLRPPIFQRPTPNPGMLVATLEGELDDVKRVETSMRELAELMNLFTMKVGRARPGTNPRHHTAP